MRTIYRNVRGNSRCGCKWMNYRIWLQVDELQDMAASGWIIGYGCRLMNYTGYGCRWMNYAWEQQEGNVTQRKLTKERFYRNKNSGYEIKMTILWEGYVISRAYAFHYSEWLEPMPSTALSGSSVCLPLPWVARAYAFHCPEWLKPMSSTTLSGSSLCLPLPEWLEPMPSTIPEWLEPMPSTPWVARAYAFHYPEWLEPMPFTPWVARAYAFHYPEWLEPIPSTTRVARAYAFHYPEWLEPIPSTAMSGSSLYLPLPWVARAYTFYCPAVRSPVAAASLTICSPHLHRATHGAQW